MDICPQQAINYSLIGVPFSTDSRVLSKRLEKSNPTFLNKIMVAIAKSCEEIFDARTLYVFSGILFGAIISGSMVTEALVRIYHLLTTGSLLFH